MRNNDLTLTLIMAPPTKVTKCIPSGWTLRFSSFFFYDLKLTSMKSCQSTFCRILNNKTHTKLSACARFLTRRVNLFFMFLQDVSDVTKQKPNSLLLCHNYYCTNTSSDTTEEETATPPLQHFHGASFTY